MLVASTIVCHSQDGRPSVEVSGTPSGSADLPHAAYVDRLLADGSTSIPQAEEAPLNTNDISALIARYRSIPSATDKAGIASALAYRGDERIVDLFWNTLTKEYAGRCFQEGKQDTYEWSNVAHLVSLLGFQATRSERAYDLLKAGVQTSFWQTNVTWSVHGQPASEYLVGESIKGLARSLRDDAWQFVLNLKTNADSVYLTTYSGALMDAGFYHHLLTKSGIGIGTGSQMLGAFEAWKRNTADGHAWALWFANVNRISREAVSRQQSRDPGAIPVPQTK